jgi:hypothetical protein
MDQAVLTELTNPANKYRLNLAPVIFETNKKL